jgi:hypothetical protein
MAKKRKHKKVQNKTPRPDTVTYEYNVVSDNGGVLFLIFGILMIVFSVWVISDASKFVKHVETPCKLSTEQIYHSCVMNDGVNCREKKDVLYEKCTKERERDLRQGNLRGID